MSKIIHKNDEESKMTDRLPSYTIVPRQINKVKGYEVSFCSGECYFDYDTLGFVKKLKEAKALIAKHKKEHSVGEHLFNGQKHS